jgi:uncharacterized protein (DUF1778 family)
MTRVNIEVDNEQYRKIKIAAATSNKYIKDYIIEILNKKAEENKTRWQ